MKIEITDRPPVKVAFLRYTGPYGVPIGRFWRSTVASWLADHGLVDCPRYGMALDDPGAIPAAQCRYDACVELPPGLTLPDAAETIIPGGRYAITRFKGTGADIAAAWNAFIGATLADSSNRLDPQRHAFEHYPRGASFDARSGSFACELCLPLAG